MKEWKRNNKDIEIRRYVVLTTLTLWEKKERKTPKETSVAEESERKKKTGPANWTQISQELWKEHFIDSRPLSTTDTLKQLRIVEKLQVFKSIF